MPIPTDTITNVTMYELDVELARRFAVASGALDLAQVAVVRIDLASGHHGWGEMAPFPAITGETRDGTLEAALQAAPALVGHSVLEYRRLFVDFKERLEGHAAARCGLETALLDAYCRRLGVPLWAHFGGAERTREHITDITIPVTDLDTTVDLSRLYHARGFRRFKLKVGVDVQLDIEKLSRVANACPDSAFVLDANAGYTLPDARRFLAGLSKGVCVLLLEQPLAAGDHEGARALRREFSVRVAADESARSCADVIELAREGAADVINLKIMKTGVREAVQMAMVARSLGLSLMLGGMLETRLAMGCSFGLALGLGGFDYLDLDTPLLLQTDPWTGGYTYRGPVLLPWSDPGLGVEPAEGAAFSPCETVGLTRV